MIKCLFYIKIIVRFLVKRYILPSDLFFQYVLRDVAKTASKKENPVYILASRHDDHHLLDKTAGSSVPSGIKALEDEIGVFASLIT